MGAGVAGTGVAGTGAGVAGTGAGVAAHGLAAQASALAAQHQVGFGLIPSVQQTCPSAQLIGGSRLLQNSGSAGPALHSIGFLTSLQVTDDPPGGVQHALMEGGAP